LTQPWGVVERAGRTSHLTDGKSREGTRERVSTVN
jgi:hypothetical protein